MRVLVLGIGNILIGDEGAGAIFSHYFKRNLAPSFFLDSKHSHSLKILDGGTMAMHLLPIIAEFDKVYVIDCISADDLAIGDVVFFDYEQVPSNINYQGSAHELEMQMSLNFMKLNGDLPECKILGIVPSRIEAMSIGLSAEVKNAFLLMKDKLLAELRNDGFLLKWQGDCEIEQIIGEFSANML